MANLPGENALRSEAAPPAEADLAERAGSGRVRRPYALAVYLAVLALFVGAGLFAPVIAPYDPGAQKLVNHLHPPSWQAGGSWAHPLGTDSLGRDELSRLMYGARISLVVVVVSVPASVLLGTLLGVLAGYRSRTLGVLLMRLVDVQLALPPILFAILLAAVLGPSLRNVLIVIVGWGWVGYARIVRGETLGLRERDFVLAARAIGANDVWIVRRHLLPNLINTVTVLATLHISTVILIEAALSFLGVGVPVTTPSWGTMVSGGNNFITVSWWLVTLPGLAIVTVSLVANLFGDWLRDALDPRLRHLR